MATKTEATVEDLYHAPEDGNAKLLFESAPVFVAEVRSEHDYGKAAEGARAAKRTDFFAAGTHAVWDVELQSQNVVRVYRESDPTTPIIYDRGDRAEAKLAFPGRSLLVDDLFFSFLAGASPFVQQAH